MQQVAIKTIGIEKLADLLAESQPLETVDTGSTVVNQVLHPKLGTLTVISSCMDREGVILASFDVADQLPN